MSSPYVHPTSGTPLDDRGGMLTASDGAQFPVIAGIPRFCDMDNYSRSFGKQWNAFRSTQVDGLGTSGNPSSRRFFAATGWNPAEVAGLDVLEVGSGAGRFSQVILKETSANLYSVDYSTAVDANQATNGALGGNRFFLSQASIYELPFPDDRFDKVVCLGVLQHTPDFEASVRALVCKAKPGAGIVVDFYPIRGFWTKLHAKYLLRPITKRMSNDQLLGLVERNADWLIGASRLLDRLKLGALRRFLPVVDISGTMPADLSPDELREWVVLDTFDMFSPAYDNPQRISAVAAMFERAGATVEFADFIDCGSARSAVVRARKR